jgi:hypothetical protein
MEILRVFKPKKTPEETQQLLQTIKDYNTALSNLNVKVRTLVGNGQILPDTATQSYKLIIDAQNWLKQNSGADVSEIQINLQELQNKFQNVLDTEPSRRSVLVWLATTASTSTELVASESITDAQQKELVTLIKSTINEYKKNEFKATPPEFQKLLNEANEGVGQIYNNDTKLLSYTQNKFTQITSLPPPELINTLTVALNKLNIASPTQTPAQASQQITLQKTAVAAATPPSARKIIMSSASSAFNIFFWIFLCLIGGSFAANLAIGRTPAYRVLYFLYGCIPVFNVLVILYIIYSRIRYGPVPLYGILPISIERPTSRLGAILWYPFWWIPDAQSETLKQEFLTSLIV